MRFAMIGNEDFVIFCIYNTLDHFFSHEKFDFDYFAGSPAFLEELERKRFDAVFLDAGQPVSDRLKIAAKLRDQKAGTHVVLLTENKKPITSKSLYHFCTSIEKHQIEAELPVLLSSLFPQPEHTLPTICVTELRSMGGKEHALVISQIVYMESDNHNIIIHLTNESVIRIRGPLSAYTSRNDFQDFIRISPGLFVNLKRVKLCDSQIVLPTGKTLYISRRRLPDVRDAYYKLQKD